MDINKSWLEAILSKKHYEESPMSAEIIQTEGACGKGDNYLSSLERIKARVHLGSGKTKIVSLIVKHEHRSTVLKKMSVDSGIFVREITMYRDILPKMENLMVEAGDTADCLWAKCYDCRLYDKIVLEDLNVAGYQMAQRRKQLTLKPTLMVVKNMAKFHALGCVLYERFELPLNIFGCNQLVRDITRNAKFHFERFPLLCKTMEHWGSEWKEAKERLEKAIPSLYERIDEFSKSHEGKFVVLNHGDCWTNNFLFKFSEDSDQPLAMKFIDMQMPHIGTPAHDFHWFTCSSVTRDTLKNHYDEILDAYYESLSGNLKKFGYQNEIPSAQFIRDEMEKYNAVHFWYATILVPIVLAEPKDAMDLEKVIQTEEDATKGIQTDQLNTFDAMTKLPKSVIQDVIRRAMEKNWF